jgi:hypothetical protein
VVRDDLAAGVDHPQLAVGAGDPVVEAPGAPLGHRRLDHAGDAGAVVGVDLVEIAAVRAAEAVGRHAVDAVQLVGPRHAVAGDVPLPAAQVGDLLRLGELGLVGPQALLRLRARGDVLQHADRVPRPVGGVAHDRGGEQRHHRPAVAVAQARLRLEAGPHAVAQALPHAAPGVLVGQEVEDRRVGELVRRAADERGQRLVDAQHGAVGRDERHPHRRALEGLGDAVEIEILAVGDVLADDVDQLAVAVDRRPVLDPPAVAVRAHDAEPGRPDGARGHQLRELRADLVLVLGMDEVPERPPQKLVLGQADDRAGGRVGAVQAAVRRGHEQRVAHQLEEPALHLLGMRLALGGHGGNRPTARASSCR